jgi:hypothetical protein
VRLFLKEWKILDSGGKKVIEDKLIKAHRYK